MRFILEGGIYRFFVIGILERYGCVGGIVAVCGIGYWWFRVCFRVVCGKRGCVDFL